MKFYGLRVRRLIEGGHAVEPMMEGEALVRVGPAQHEAVAVSGAMADARRTTLMRFVLGNDMEIPARALCHDEGSPVVNVDWHVQGASLTVAVAYADRRPAAPPKAVLAARREGRSWARALAATRGVPGLASARPAPEAPRKTPKKAPRGRPQPAVSPVLACLLARTGV